MSKAIIACKIDGCHKDAFRRGMCAMHWQRERRDGDALRPDRQCAPHYTLDERIDFYINKSTWDNECLIVPLHGNTFGHAQINYRGRMLLLHRLILERKLGRTLTDGECALHSCHRPKCINPGHLRPGTKKDNYADMIQAGRERHLRGEEHPCATITEATVRKIRANYAQGVDKPTLSQWFGITRAHVYLIVSRRCWKHI